MYKQTNKTITVIDIIKKTPVKIDYEICCVVICNITKFIFNVNTSKLQTVRSLCFGKKSKSGVNVVESCSQPGGRSQVSFSKTEREQLLDVDDEISNLSPSPLQPRDLPPPAGRGQPRLHGLRHRQPGGGL